MPTYWDYLPREIKQRYWVQPQLPRDGYTFFVDSSGWAGPGEATMLGFSPAGWRMTLPAGNVHTNTRYTANKSIFANAVEVVMSLGNGGAAVACQIDYETTVGVRRTGPAWLQPCDGRTYVNYLDLTGFANWNGTLATIYLLINVPSGHVAIDHYLKAVRLVADRSYFFSPPPTDPLPTRASIGNAMSGDEKMSSYQTINWDWPTTYPPTLSRLRSLWRQTQNVYVGSSREDSFANDGLRAWTRFAAKMQWPQAKHLGNSSYSVQQQFIKAVEDLT